MESREEQIEKLLARIAGLDYPKAKITEGSVLRVVLLGLVPSLVAYVLLTIENWALNLATRFGHG